MTWRAALILAGLLLACTQQAQPPQAGPPLEWPIGTATPSAAVALHLPAHFWFDAHDGAVRLFGGTYFLYGTVYSCGFGDPGSPFCGFRAYTSRDLVNWQQQGLLFARSPEWDRRCGGNAGCFRPKVVFNQKTGRYVLWFNGSRTYNPFPYVVLTSNSPLGPFQRTSSGPACCGNRSRNGWTPFGADENGDEDVFVDRDGAAYLVSTEIRHEASGRQSYIEVERLTDDYTSSSGEEVWIPFPGRQVESPALFERHGVYHLLVSDPTCAYCTATGTGWLTAPSPLGPWSWQGKVSKDSCGGQPSAVSTLPQGYLFQSDLWLGTRNEDAALQLWSWLRFDGDRLLPIDCGRPR